jgi:uncharacterized membrane protein YhaH (DUF805 family)
MSWYFKVLKNYAVFSGRARRKEYWLFLLCNLPLMLVLIVIDTVLTLSSRQSSAQGGPSPLTGLYMLGLLIPFLAVTVRRLHDTGRNGSWLLISLIPLVGGIMLLFFMAESSQPGDNQYGPDPTLSASGRDGLA